MRRFHLMIVAGTLAACSDPEPPPPSQLPPAMEVLGNGSVPVPPYVAEVAAAGTTAYTTTWSFNSGFPGNRVDIWDISGDTPTKTGSVTISGPVVTTGDVSVSDDGLVMIVATERSPGKIVVFDISDPRAPRELTSFSSPNTQPGVHTAKLGRVNGRLYATLAVNPSSTLTPRTVVVDLGDPAQPREVHARPANISFVHDTFLRDGVLFIAQWGDGLIILDVGGLGLGGTIANPVEAGRIVTVGGQVHNVWWFHDPTNGAKRYAFVGQEGPAQVLNSSNGDVHVVDVSDPTDPREVAVYSGGPSVGTHNFWMDEAEGVLYAAFYNGGVRALNVRGDLSSCSDAHRDAMGRCDLGLMGREIGRGLQDGTEVYVWGVRYHDGSLLASDMLGRLWKLRGVTQP
jgi:hypothetical protein